MGVDILEACEDSGCERHWARRSLDFISRTGREKSANGERRFSLAGRQTSPRTRDRLKKGISADTVLSVGFDEYESPVGLVSPQARRAVKVPHLASRQQHPEPLHLKGRLRKRAKMVHMWKDFFFKLQDSCVYCFEIDRSGNEKDKITFSLLDAEIWTIDNNRTVLVRTTKSFLVEFLPKTREEGREWVKILTTAAARHFDKVYSMGQALGSGNFSSVYLAYDHIRQPVAVKIMQKKRADKEVLDSVKREVQFLRQRISHPCVVRTLDMYDTKHFIYIVMECITGGTLLEAVESRGVLSEDEARGAMRCILEGLSALHAKHVVHRDLKLENVLLADRDDMESCKVADFGLSELEKLGSNGKDWFTRGMYGTPLYCSPEIARDEWYNVKVDIWSAGVILYRILSGVFPFDGESVRDVLERIKDGVVVFPESRWEMISPQAKNIIRAMLSLEPEQRPDCAALLKNDWFRRKQ